MGFFLKYYLLKEVCWHHSFRALFLSTQNRSRKVHPNDSLRFFNQEVLLLFTFFLLFTFPCIIIISSSYFSPLITWPRYSNFLFDFMLMLIIVSAFRHLWRCVYIPHTVGKCSLSYIDALLPLLQNPEMSFRIELSKIDIVFRTNLTTIWWFRHI